MTAPIKLKRKARGERPYFFADPNVDKVIAMVMGLAGEVAVMRDRLDTLERLLERSGALQRTDIDTFVPDADAVAERAAWRETFLAEVLRIVEIEVEALASGDTARYDTAIGLVEDLPRAPAKPAARATAKKRTVSRAAPKPAKKKAAPRKAAPKPAKRTTQQGPAARAKPHAPGRRKPQAVVKKGARH